MGLRCMKVLIVDHHVLFRQGLTSLLNNEPDFQVVGEADNAVTALELAVALQPDLVIIDVALPDNSGIEALHGISANCPGTKIVILTTSDSNELLVESIRAGAKGYLLKNMPISKLLVALRAVNQGETAISRRMTDHILDEFRRVSYQPVQDIPGLEMLTKRETEIMTLLGKDASNEEIAHSLKISENTVKVHVHNIIHKLNVRNRREAGAVARNMRLSSLDISS
jgi:DNA-binding NarL/FixJ family response regulator